MFTIAKVSYEVIALFSFVAFRVLYHVLRARIFIPLSLPLSKAWLYRNTLLSLVHACISPLWAIYCFYDKPTLVRDLLNDWSFASYYLLAFMIGYVVHDSLDIVLNDFSGSTGLIVHHVVVFVITGFVLSTEKYIPMATSLLLMEFNSIFLHVRRLMRFCGEKSSSLAYKMNLAGLFVSFVALRCVLLLWLSAYFVHIRQIIPSSHFLLATTGFLALIVVNTILFFRLFRTEFRTFSKRTKE